MHSASRTDFVVGTGKLEFTLIDPVAVGPGDQAFSFIGTAAFADTGLGQIHCLNSGADLLVQSMSTAMGQRTWISS